MASTPIFLCSGDCGVNAAGTSVLSTNGQHWSSFGASVSVVASTDPTGPDMPGLRCYKFNPAAKTDDTLVHLFPTAIGSPSTLVVRVKVQFQTLPNAIRPIVSNQSGTAGVRYNPTGTQLEAWAGATTPVVAGAFVPTVGVTYTLLVKMVRDTTTTCDWQVDGNAQTQASKGAQTAGTTTAVTFGSNANAPGNASATGTYYMSDMLVSGTAADYTDAQFTGDTTFVALFPNGDGTHSFTDNDFAEPTAANTKLHTATDIWTGFKQDTGGGTNGVGLNSTIGTFLSQVVIRSTGYCEIAFDDMPSVSSIAGVSIISEHHGSTTGAHTQSLRLEDGATESVVLALADSSDLTVSYNDKCYATAPSTGAWTKTKVDALLARWGYSTDVTGNPILDGMCLEVAYLPVSGQTLTLTAATTTVEAEALTIAPGGVTLTLGVATVTVQAQALTITSAAPAITPIFLCGAECGVVVAGTSEPTGALRHWAASAGTAPTVATSGPSPMRSTRALRFNPSGAQSALLHTFSAAVASPATIVGRFYVYFATLPSADVTIFDIRDGSNNVRGGVAFQQSSGTLRAQALGSTYATGIAITTGRWYRVDVEIVCGNPATCDIQIDGVSASQASVASANSNAANFRLGLLSAVTADMYIDDICLSGTAANYPLGDGSVIGLYPNGDGTHSFTAGDFVDETGAAIATNATTAWQHLKNPLSNVSTGVEVRQDVIRSTGYLEFAFENLPSTPIVNGLAVVSEHYSEGTGAHTQSLRLEDGATEDPILALVDYSDTTPSFNYKRYAVSPRTGVSWTAADVNALLVRWGYSTDVIDKPDLGGVMLEVDYLASILTLTPATVTVEAEALTVVPGGVALTLSPATATIQAQALTMAAAAALTLTPATATLSAQPLTLTAGGVTLTLGVATVTVQAQTLTLVAAVALALSPATITTEAEPLTIVAAATLALSPALATVEAEVLTVVPGGVALTLAPASITVEAEPLTISTGGGAQTADLDPAAITVEAQPLTIAAATTLTLSSASMTVAAQALTVSAAVSVSLTAASLTVEAEPLTLVATATLTLTPATLTLEAQPLALAAGGVTLTLGVATVTVSAVALDIQAAGAGQLPLSAATLTVQAQPLTIAPGGITLTLSPAQMTVQAQPLGITPATVLSLVAAVLTIEAQPLTLSTAVALALSAATIQLEAQPLAVTYEHDVAIDLTAATIVVEAQELVVVWQAPPIKVFDFPEGPDTITETIPYRARSATLAGTVEEETLTDVVDSTRRYW